ncbi:hypothetical protein F5884DRAFT_841320 [Xylogone sp. PMI_703]|nr:hypothetical protein F5884DRAFT_841320 [Xylogone sp. PMI_703]
MHTLQSILIIGGTGAFGKSFCTALTEHKEYFSRIAVYHDISRPTDANKRSVLDRLHTAGIEIVTGSAYDGHEQYNGFDCVMSFLGNHALHEQPRIFEAAIKAGVRHFYPSEYGADLLVGDNWNQRYYKYKRLTREFLEKKAESIPDLGWTYFQLGRLTEWSVLSHFGIDNKNATARIYGRSTGRQSLLSVEDSIKYLIETLKDPLPDVKEEAGATKGRRRSYRFHGSSPTWQEIFDILKRITGREYQVTYLDVESAKHEEADAIREGDVDKELSASHKLIQGREGTLLPEPWDNDRFPFVKPEPVEETLAAAFQNEDYRKFYGLS